MWFQVLAVALFISLCAAIRPTTKERRALSPALLLSMAESFREVNCVRFLGESPHDDILAALHNQRISPCILLIANYSSCDGLVLSTQSVFLAREMLLKEHLTAKHTVIIMITSESQSRENEDLDLLTKETVVFGEARAAVIWLRDETIKIMFESVLPPRVWEERKEYQEADGKPRSLFYNEPLLAMQTTLANRVLRVSTFLYEPFIYLNHDRNGHPHIVDGVEGQLIQELCLHYGCSLEVWETTGAIKWGNEKNGSYHGGTLGEVVNHHADLAIGSVWTSLEKHKYFDMTVTGTQVCVTFLVRRPGKRGGWHALLRPLSFLLWVLIVLATVTMSLVLYVLTHAQKSLHLLTGGRRYLSWLTSILEIAEMLVSVGGSPKALNMGASRHVVSSWALFSMLVQTAYSSGLISRLTSPSNVLGPDTIEELAGANYTWIKDFPPPLKLYLDMENPWHIQLSRGLVIIPKEEITLRFKTETRLCVVGEDLSGTYFLNEGLELDSDVLLDSRTISECTNRYFLSVITRKHSGLTPFVRTFLGRITDAGILSHWQSEVPLRLGDPAILRLMAKEETSTTRPPKALALRHLSGVFYMIILGHLCSTLIFITEIFFHFLINQHNKFHQNQQLNMNTKQPHQIFLRIPTISKL